MKRIFVIGSSNTDLVVKCPKLPKPGETVLGGDLIQANGGKGANQAVAAARLGGNVVFLCKVGGDAFGQDNINAYVREGIETQYIITDKDAASGAALILVDNAGENSIAVAPGANSRLSLADVDTLRDVIHDGDVMLLQLEIPLNTVIHAARIGRERGAVVILDPAPAPGGGLPDELLRSLDYITPNQHEADALASACGGCGADAMLQRGVKNVVITKDKEGCVLLSNDGSRSFPAYPVKAVDSTAAGDAFAGALAVGLSEGYNLENAISWAQQAAAVSVTRMGAQPSLPTRKELLAYNF
ncbi:MAG: ribokinase [Candidatus Hinthialibacter antarcticus]|nr:ribokinase [Candidatus Hinthialibacter antarcticus]